MLLLIDNFDSFTYNLVHAFEQLGQEVMVVRNKQYTVTECLKLNPRHVVIGPGPGGPAEAGISIHLMRACAGRVPVLGVCLGHQCLSHLYGGHVRRGAPVHGKTARIFHGNQGVFNKVQRPFSATRYHSLVVDKNTLPGCLEVTAETAEGEVMGLRHRTYQMEGVQFHPESILTEHGAVLLQNFCNKE